MVNSLKVCVALIAIISLGLFLTSCTSSNATQAEKRSTSDASTKATQSETERMKDMNMPSKQTKPKQMEAAGAANQVVIENFAFAPATLTVKAGTTVTWSNRDDEPHTVNENDKRFKSGTMDTGDQYSYTFSSAGTFSYFCALHPKMTGQIIVE